MSLKDTDVRTPGDKAIAKKFKLSLAKVRSLVKQGAEHEKEHNTNLAKAEQVARDHIGERPDYYKMLKKAEKTDKNHMSEDFSSVGGVRGLGLVTGDPAVGLNSYINTNAMAYEDENGNKLEYLKKQHTDLHNSKLGYSAFDPTKIGAMRNFGNLKEQKLNELGEYDNKGGTVGAEGLTDTAPVSLKRRSVKEEKPCWKGYEAIGMKKKNGKKVPNCVPVKEQGVGIRSYTEKPLVEKKPTPDAMPDGADRGIYQEGYASIGHSFDWAGDVNRRAKFYGSKPKPTTTKNDEKDDTYKDSKQGGKVKLVKTVKEDAVTVAATQHMDAAQSGYQQSAKPSRSRVNLRGSTAHVKGAEYRSGTGSARASLGTGGQMKPTSTNVPTRFMRSVKNAPSTQGASGQMKPTSTSGSSSFTQNSQSRSMNVGKGMGMSKQTSPVVKGMSAAGQEASKKIVPKAASVMATVGKAARALSGPEGAAVTAAAEPLAKKMASSYKAGHQSFASHGSEGEKTSTVFARMKQPSQGRSVSQYEKDVLTPKASEAPKAPENPKVDAPTPPSRPDYFSRGQAFGAARGEAGGGEGKFSYDNKQYQTNVTGEPYKPSSQLKQTSVKEETKMDTREHINEAIVNIMENNLPEMKDNLLVALQEKAMEKLEERKKEIAANYFAE